MAFADTGFGNGLQHTTRDLCFLTVINVHFSWWFCCAMCYHSVKTLSHYQKAYQDVERNGSERSNQDKYDYLVMTMKNVNAPATGVFSHRFIRVYTLMKEIFLVQNFIVFIIYWLLLYPDDHTRGMDVSTYFMHGCIVIPHVPELLLVRHKFNPFSFALIFL